MDSTTKMASLLVIGGGIGGCSSIVGLRRFDKESQIVLVEPKDHCEIYWASYRSPFEEWVAEGSLLPLEKWCEKNDVKHVRSTVKKLHKRERKAELANGEFIPYDAAVVATGAGTKAPFLGRGLPADSSNNSADGNRQTRLDDLKKHGERMLSADSVLVVGGGLVGAELAGDIAWYAKKQKKTIDVTLVHSGPHLCHVEMRESASGMLKKKLEKLGVRVILNERAEENEGGQMVLSKSGEVLELRGRREVVYVTGNTSVNGFLREDFPDALNENGFVISDEYFRVRTGGGRLFTMGDCSTFLPNSGYQYLDNSKSIGRNIHRTLSSVAGSKDGGDDGGNNGVPSDDELKKGSASIHAVVATAGPRDGVFDTSMFHTQMFLPTIKNKTMFFFHVKHDLGF